MPSCIHDGGEIVHHITHERPFAWVVVPHALHQVDQVGPPMFGQCFRFRSVSKRSTKRLSCEIPNSIIPIATYLTLFWPTLR